MALYTKEYIICPWCEKDSGKQVDHLYAELPCQVSFRLWYCDTCGRPFRGIVLAPHDVAVERDYDAGRFSRSFALLKIESVAGPVFFVIDHRRYYDGSTESLEEMQEHDRFFFEEHSCPTNWLQDCVLVIDGKDGDCDPHGILEFVRSVDVPDDFEKDGQDDQWRELFPEAFAKIQEEA